MMQFLLVLAALVASTYAQILEAPENVTVTIGLIDDFAEATIDDLFVSSNAQVTVLAQATSQGFLEIQQRDLAGGVTVVSLRTLGGQTSRNLDCEVTTRQVRTSSRRKGGSRRTEIDTSTACAFIELSGNANDVQTSLRRIKFSFENNEVISFRTNGVENDDIVTIVNREISALGVILASCCTIGIVCACCVAGAWFLRVHYTSGTEIKGYADQQDDDMNKLKQENDIATPVNNYNVAVPQNNYNVAVPQQNYAMVQPQQPVVVGAQPVPVQAVPGTYNQGMAF